jgi:hypothetical protein
MENRTPIYDLQNHCNSRYTIAPNLRLSEASNLEAD